MPSLAIDKRFSVPLAALNLPDQEATEKLGQQMAALIRERDCILLSGDLGAGKTTFARGLIRQKLAHSDTDIPSPTFSLVQFYETTPPLWHYDFYRLKDPEEVWELGLEESLEDICLIEWPEKAAAACPETALLVHLHLAPEMEDNARTASFYIASTLSEKETTWPTRLSPLLKEFSS